MTKETLDRILNIASFYNKGMNDYGICSPTDLVIKRIPELFVEIDEDKLEELAGLVCAKEFIGTWDMSNIVCNITNDLEQAAIDAYNVGFKAGYRKAKEE